MSPEAQRLVIAVACGWKYIDNNPDLYPYWLAPTGDSRYGNPLDANLFPKAFPDYLNSLNAMHEAEKVLEGGMRSKYDAELTIICERDYNFIWESTAAQRAEAFLRTIGKCL